MKPHRFLRNLSFGSLKPRTGLWSLVWSPCRAQNHRGHPTRLYVLAWAPQKTGRFLGPKLGHLGHFSGLPGSGCKHTYRCVSRHLLRFLDCLEPLQVPAAARTWRSASLPFKSFGQLNPEVSGSAHSPQTNLRPQGCSSQLLVTPDRWSLGTGYPKARNEAPAF